MLSLLLSGAAAAFQPSTPTELRFEQAEFTISDSETPPENGWRPQALPDSWLHNHRGFAGVAWYRMRFALATVPAAPIGLLIGRMASTGQVWVNGSVLNPETRFTDPGGRIGTITSYKPYRTALPSGLLELGDNVIHIRLQGFGVGGEGLWDVRVGPMAELRGPWLVRAIPQQMIPQMILVLMAPGVIIGVFVWWRRRLAGYGHFAIVMILWTVIIALNVLPDPGYTIRGRTISVIVLMMLFYWALLSLFYRYSESDWHWYLPVLHVVSALALALSLATILFGRESPQAPMAIGVASSMTAFLRVLATVMLVQAARRRRSLRGYAFAAAEVIWFAGQLQVIGILLGWLQPDPFRLEPATTLPLYLVLLFFFVDRLIRDRDQAIRDRHAAVSAERLRILQDMHDGMGAQLVTALRLAKREDADRTLVARGIESALQDLRLIIDSLDAREQGLVPLLANLRHRLEPQLAALGIRLDWQAQTLPELDELTPEVALGVLRIVQEALNNAVKHARASVITLSIALHEGRVAIGVADDGIGFDPVASQGIGRGLSGMRRRAERLGARLCLKRANGGGTVVSLQLCSAAGTVA